MGIKRLLQVTVYVFLMLAGLALITAAFADTLALPDDLVIIEDEAFCKNTSLDTVLLPEGIQQIGSRAFAESGLTSVNLPDSLTGIADNAFDSVFLADVSFPETGYAHDWAM